MAKPPLPKQIDALKHGDKRINIPTAEMQSFFQREEDHAPRQPVEYPRARPLAEGESRERNPDLDPQLIWNGARITISKDQAEKLAETGSLEIGDAQLVWRDKDPQDWQQLVVQVPPIYIQEKIHPKALIADLKRAKGETQAPDLFADFNGVPPDAAAEFYAHDQHWSNRMIVGDSLQVMASLAERERLRGKVQCIYFDPPYGIKFNSNWQVSTQSRDVKDGKQTDISREPEQVKAFRDTWKDGIHSYLTYLRDRLTVMRDLLTTSGSIFVQIGDENVHRVRAVMDEVFGEANFVSNIKLRRGGAQTAAFLAENYDGILWFAKSADSLKFRPQFQNMALQDLSPGQPLFVDYETKTSGWNRKDVIPEGARVFTHRPTFSATGSDSSRFAFFHTGIAFNPPANRGWSTNFTGLSRMAKADRFFIVGRTLRRKTFHDDFPVIPVSSAWDDTIASGFSEQKIYVVQTIARAIERCILMATDPGDLVLDPTCGSGTSAYVAEQWGRRWITIDTSRVAVALARTRLMAARYPWYLLADSPEGMRKEAALQGKPPPERSATHDLRQGFVYERVPHITLKSIANNSRIDDIWDRWQTVLEPIRGELNAVLAGPPPAGEVARAEGDRRSTAGGVSPSPVERALAADTPSARAKPEPLPPLGGDFEEWQIPREAPDAWPDAAKTLLPRWWDARIARQREIDAAIAQAADTEYLYDRPYSDNARVRVSGPFTVESLSPHRIVAGDQQDDHAGEKLRAGVPQTDFAQVVMDYLKTVGIHQARKADAIRFDSIAPWPGVYVGAKGRFAEGESIRRAAILIGPEYGTVGRGDLVTAAREANDAGFDLLIACAFNFDAHSSELNQLGPLPILKARMNPDLHMAGELKNSGKGNMFVIFGEPDIKISTLGDGRLQVEVRGVDVYDPNSGDIRSGNTDSIACWFIDTDYSEESFFVRHAYFLGANDPLKSLKTALKAEIDEEAWATLYSATSRPFERPASGKIAVKVINHFGDEVMKVYGV